MAAGSRFDVAILGAGAAGLEAARVLTARGAKAVLLEAAARVGGRMHTVRDPASALPIELGAEFVHGRPAETWDIIRSARLMAYDVADTHFVPAGAGKVRKDEGFWDRVEEVLGRLTTLEDADVSYAEFLSRHGRGLDERTKSLATGFVEGFNAADRDVISARGLVRAQEASDEIEGDRLFRIVTGQGALVEQLSHGLDPRRVRLNHVVRAVRWKLSRVRIECVSPGGAALPAVEAEKVIVALPLGVMQSGAILWEPAIPASHRHALALLRMGPVVKVMLVFSEAWWEALADDLNFLHDPEASGRGGEFPTWWTTLPIRSTLLTGWAGGRQAAGLSAMSDRAILISAMRTLSRLSGRSRTELAGMLHSTHVANWQKHPLFRGAYSYPAVAGANAASTLSRPIDKRIFLAGEHTHDGLSGTVAGAISSGRRAARDAVGY